jgi:hypothetical protein
MTDSRMVTDKLAKRIIHGGLCTWWSMHGCWNFEIKELERHFDIRLPEIYKSFLKKMGKGAGKFMRGTDFFYRHLFANRNAFEEVLASDGKPFSLSANTFVFSSHQGYIFHFFECGNPDPPVYGYSEGDMKVKKINNSFSEFMIYVVEEEIEGWSKIES